MESTNHLNKKRRKQHIYPSQIKPEWARSISYGNKLNTEIPSIGLSKGTRACQTGFMQPIKRWTSRLEQMREEQERKLE